MDRTTQDKENGGLKMRKATNWYNIYKFDESTMTPISYNGNCVLVKYQHDDDLNEVYVVHIKDTVGVFQPIAYFWSEYPAMIFLEVYVVEEDYK